MSISTWFHSLLGTVETKVQTIEPEIIAWAKNFLSTITPIIKEAATDAVLAAVTVPGSGAVKAAAALASATADLATKGIPVVENDLKAAIQIAYNALPASVTGNAAAAAVETAATNEVSALAAKVDTASLGTASATTAQAS
jgi:hypothetical protein